MITVKIKICGITNLEDAQAAVEMGADILGFNFYPASPRYIEMSEAEKIISHLPGFVDIAGVFVTGKTFDWAMLKKYSRRIFLAGGISPDNIAKALETNVYGIDICSGIESEPGKKDHAKMEQLFDNIYSFTGIKVRK
ncbi:MAG: hypothetical protein B6I25_04910 [Planctomycetales bacterium 4572_13]|nr:MAG: hypothetical protein B6I25_04910 [Planctomycetales bacterium 4572_13]